MLSPHGSNASSEETRRLSGSRVSA